MSDFQLGLSAIALPQMYHVRQTFPAPEITDVAAAVRAAVLAPEVAVTLQPGMRVALAVGSRGIAGLATIVKAVIAAVRERGCTVVIVPTMGSHGGGTPEGQVAVLASYGVTEAAMGVPIISTMATQVVGALRFDALSGTYRSDPHGDMPVPVSSDVLACDVVIPVARIKAHTGFRGAVESGICKMLCVGLGKHAGCSRYHREGYPRFAALIPAAAQVILAKVNVAFALAVVENAAERTAMIEAVLPGDILVREPQLLIESRRLMARLMLPNIDVLVIERIGKDISGTGMDPNIIGRSENGVLPDYAGPQIGRIVVLDLSEGTRGNATGIGFADLITERCFQAIDRRVTYTNVMTSGSLYAGKFPIALPDESTAIRAALSCLPGKDPAHATVVRIRDTLHLRDIAVSTTLLPHVQQHPDMKVMSAFVTFDSDMCG
jgi:hypothetical protein